MSLSADGLHAGSFRDPAGHMLTHGGKLYRQVNHLGKQDYDHLLSSGLYDTLVAAGLMVAHKEVPIPKNLVPDTIRYKLIQPTNVPFISYPYEWTFLQLKQAALTTLRILKIALEHGMILKDSSAYNIQFIGNQPILIDTLSLTVYKPGSQWEGYKQFCEHFIAPLALAQYASPEVLKTQRVFLDGMPLNIACSLLPHRARLKSGLLAHLYLHNSSQRKHQQGGDAVAGKAKQRKMTNLAMQGLLASLEKTVKKLKGKNTQTEWGDYYSFTNYSDDAFQKKRTIVEGLLRQVSPAPKMVWDIGANNGEFSELGVLAGAYTVAFDIDEVAVARNVAADRPKDVKRRMLPLVQDLTNPSPSIGWAHQERMSMAERGPADVVMALALIHHLAIGNNLPFDRIASFLQQIGTHIIIEFVPKGDSKVDHLLASRKDIFDHYTSDDFESAMARHFKLIAKKSVEGSKRSIYLYSRSKI